MVPCVKEGGDGQHSIIIRAKDGRKPVVLKFDGPWNDDYRSEAFQREYTLLAKLKGQDGIVQILGEQQVVEAEVRASADGPGLPYLLRYFPMEEAPTDMAAVIYSGERTDKIMGQLLLFRAACRGVARLHRNGICHRDLKPGNLLVFGPNEVKVGDLGCARELGEGVKGILEAYDFPRGDVRYTAPELLCVARECDRGFLDGDLYSLGTILFELITGRVFGDYVYSLEYLRDLARAFGTMPRASREDIFGELLPSIIEAHPLPRLVDLTRMIPPMIPPSIENRLERLYRGLTEPRAERRLSSFDRVFGQMEIITRVLRYEEKRRQGGPNRRSV